MQELNPTDVIHETEQLRKDLDRIQQETEQKLQNTLAQIHGMEKTFNTTIGLIRKQRDTANDQVVQQQVHVVYLKEVEQGLRSEIASLLKTLSERDAAIGAYERENSAILSNLEALKEDRNLLREILPHFDKTLTDLRERRNNTTTKE